MRSEWVRTALSVAYSVSVSLFAESTSLVIAAVPKTSCASWVERVWGPPRSGHAAAWDSSRNELIIVGPCTLDTWTYDGVGWEQLYTGDQNGPFEVAFDGSRGVGVTLGGGINGCPDGRTWEWDGVDWTRPTLTVEPPEIWENDLAYDAARQVVLSFGGWYFTGCNPYCFDLSENLWAYDGTGQWVKIADSGGPSGREGTDMVYDVQRAVTLLFGGFSLGDRNDTWEWDGSGWTERVPQSSPAARLAHTMAYDSSRNVVLLTGGYSDAVWMFDDTCEWVAQACPTNGETASITGACVFQGSRFARKYLCTAVSEDM